ncbi:hypothetical protein [Streptomyces sp. JW3]|uniref:hypothetical protein n=1 Tax=Streptomyces sp. JW3 TaxID=3456955 RepID=UPI003FA43312
MTAGYSPKPANIQDFLTEVRRRPSMRVAHGSLCHLYSMLLGYRIALDIHGITEPTDFWSPADEAAFTHWLHRRLGRDSSLTWAAEIEREAQTAGVPAMDLFFELLDDYRAGRQQGSQR